MSLHIEDQALFEQALSGGLNLFLGAGFSKLASSKGGKLPLGAELEAELRKEFEDLALPEGLDLSQLSTVIKAQQPVAFRDFCNQRFSVQSFDPAYMAIFNARIWNVFTTNVDDLIPKLVDAAPDRYLHDVFLAGSGVADSRSVTYFALHGSVLHPQRDLVFGTTEIASAYGNDPQLWNLPTLG